MTFLLDVNVLMALLWENHEHHRIARNWLHRVTNFATCPMAQLGFARVSSHPTLGYSMSPDQAFGVLRGLLSDPRHLFVPDDLSCADRILRTDLMAGSNQITDHYLIAIAQKHRHTVATFDGGVGKRVAEPGARRIGSLDSQSQTRMKLLPPSIARYLIKRHLKT